MRRVIQDALKASFKTNPLYALSRLERFASRRNPKLASCPLFLRRFPGGAEGRQTKLRASRERVAANPLIMVFFCSWSGFEGGRCPRAHPPGRSNGRRRAKHTQAIRKVAWPLAPLGREIRDREAVAELGRGLLTYHQ